MSVLSDADIIAKKPIGNGLDAFRRLFGEKCKDLGISEVRELAETSDIGIHSKLYHSPTLLKLHTCNRPLLAFR